MKKIIPLLILAISICCIAFAHSGRTDSSGDYSTGEYHYHHGYSAHQHINGICPYKTTTSLQSGKNVQILEDKIQELEQSIKYKQSSIGDLNNQISESKQEIDKLEKDKKILHIIYVTIIIALILCFKYDKTNN